MAKEQFSEGISVQVEIMHCCRAEMDFANNGEACPEEYKGKIGFRKFESGEEIKEYWIPAVKVSVYNLRDNAIILGEHSPEIRGQIILSGGQKAQAICTKTVNDPSKVMLGRVIEPGDCISDVMVGRLGIMAVQPFIKKEGYISLDVNGECIKTPVTAFSEAISYAETMVDHDIEELYRKAKMYYHNN